MSRALVTGGTGMLGSYVVHHLLNEGASVRVLARNPARAESLSRRGVEVVAGDICDAASLARAVHGVDVVYHAAATIGGDSDWGAYRRGNVEGTRHVLEAVLRGGARLVHVSSTAVFGRHRFFDRPTDETVPLPELPPEDAYGRSKQESEKLVLAAHRSGKGWVTVVRPPVMYGLRDRQFVPRIAPLIRRGVLPLLAGGSARMTLVHGDAVAQGMILASRLDVARGRVHHLTDDFPVTVKGMVEWAAQGLGVRVRWIPLPGPLGSLAFSGLAVALRVAGRSDLARHLPGTRSMLTRDNPFCSQRARAELGWRPEVHPSEGLPEAFRAWIEDRHGGPAVRKEGA